MLLTAHIQNDDLELYIREDLASEDASDLQAHVKQCATCEERLVTSLLARLSELSREHSDQARRLDRRFRKGEHGSLQTLSPLSFEQSEVQIVNISKIGIGLLMNACLPTGTLVQVRFEKNVAVGEIRHCEVAEHGQFYAGIHVEALREVKRTPR